MFEPRRRATWAGALCVAFIPVLSTTADEILPDNDVIMRALVNEMVRSKELQLEDLEKPYFIQYTVDDTVQYQISASYGAIVQSNRNRTRRFTSRIRVGSKELDNSNYSGSGGGFFFGGGGGGGGRATLPIDDDAMALRQAIWWASDSDYKDAVETLTKKRAYMKDKRFDDRPNDFSDAPPVEHIEPGAELLFDQAQWRKNVERLSARFKRFDRIQDADVQMFSGAGNTFVVNTDGTRLRTGDTGVLISITAEAQADDGMRLSNSISYSGDATRDLPEMDTLLADIDTMAKDLIQATEAPILEQYTGPVLFDGVAAAQMFRQLLAEGVAGSVDPVGTGRRRFEGAENLEKKLGRRILPRSFRVYDDPTIREFDGKVLFGHYRFDDEGVKAERVDIVIDGKLENMVMSRVPTKKLSGTNGHGRSPAGGGLPEAAIGCLFIEDREGMSDKELQAELIEAAEDEGLEYGIRVKSLRSAGIGSSQSDIMAFFMRMRQGQRGGLSDPIFVYKVYVKDGREELVRGCEFGPVEVRSLRDIIAAGKKPTVYNYIDLGIGGASPPSTIIAPSVLFSEMELSKIEQEQDKLPILKSPLMRDAS